MHRNYLLFLTPARVHWLQQLSVQIFEALRSLAICRVLAVLLLLGHLSHSLHHMRQRLTVDLAKLLLLAQPVHLLREESLSLLKLSLHLLIQAKAEFLFDCALVSI